MYKKQRSEFMKYLNYSDEDIKSNEKLRREELELGAKPRTENLGPIPFPNIKMNWSDFIYGEIKVKRKYLLIT